MSWVLDYEILKLTSIWCKLTSHHWSLIDRLLLFLLTLLDVKFNPLWWSITFWVALFRFIISHVFLLFIKFIVELVLLKLELGNFTKEKIAILYDHKVVSSSDKNIPRQKKEIWILPIDWLNWTLEISITLIFPINITFSCDMESKFSFLCCMKL